MYISFNVLKRHDIDYSCFMWICYIKFIQNHIVHSTSSRCNSDDGFYTLGFQPFSHQDVNKRKIGLLVESEWMKELKYHIQLQPTRVAFLRDFESSEVSTVTTVREISILLFTLLYFPSSECMWWISSNYNVQGPCSIIYCSFTLTSTPPATHLEK